MGSSRALQSVIELEEQHSCTAYSHPDVTHILSPVLTTLGKSPDIQRGITRIFHRTAKAAEFIGVIQAILTSGKQLQKLNVEDGGCSGESEEKTVKSGLLKRLILTASSSTVVARAAKLLSSLNKDAANQGDMLNLFCTSDEQFPEVARSRIAVQIAKEKLDLLIVQYRKQLGMRTLDFMTVSGTTHLIELPSNVRVPSNWVKVNSTKKVTRYHPPEVLTALDGLSLAKEELAVVCRATWDSFLMEFGEHYCQFQAAVQALAALDCLHSLATLSRNKDYVRPVFVDEDEPVQIHIHSGRHPVLESILGDSFVPNDTELHGDGERCQIVTGPNMGGKSCYIRQVALIAIMAQVGSFVPASSAKLYVLDGVYTRMGASDSIQQGTSTFFEEVSEASHILQNCSSHSLVILDELGRGTSTHDGVALAYATLHHLLEQKKCLVLFVTHYPKILDIQKEFEGHVRPYHVSYLTSQKPLKIMELKSEYVIGYPDQPELTFLYKVVSGASDKSFGLNVARLAQLPSSCIARAAIMAEQLEAELNAPMKIKAKMISMGMTTQPEELRNCSERLKFQCTEDEHLEHFTEVCHKFFSYIRSPSTDADPENVLRSLKEARKIALHVIERGGSSILCEDLSNSGLVREGCVS